MTEYVVPGNREDPAGLRASGGRPPYTFGNMVNPRDATTHANSPQLREEQ